MSFNRSRHSILVATALLALGCASGSRIGTDAGVGDAGPAPVDPCSAVKASAADIDNYQSALACLRATEPPPQTKKAAVQTFVDSVEAHDGFPIARGDERIVVFLGGDPWDARLFLSARVTGSFAAWGDGSALVNEGVGFFHSAVTIPAADRVGASYKLALKDASGTETWLADPLARRFGYDLNGEYSMVEGSRARSHLERFHKVHATRLGNDREVDVFLPKGYVEGTARYPVLYMHDGQNLFDPNGIWGGWHAGEVADSEIAAGNARPFLIAAPFNTPGRMEEYTHVADDMAGPMTGGKGDDYGDFLVNEVKPLVDGRYRTLSDKANTGLLGSSLGGLISYYLGLKHPDVFRWVGGMSSTFDWGLRSGQGMVALYAAATDLPSRAQVFYLDSGGGPPAAGTCASMAFGDDGDNYCQTVAMKDALVANGIDVFPNDPSAALITPANANILHWWEPDAQHNEAAWHARLYRVYRLFFRP